MNTDDLNERERQQLAYLIAHAKLNGCSCTPYRITWAEVTEPEHWKQMRPDSRQAAELLGERGVYLDHQERCFVRRVGAAIWN